MRVGSNPNRQSQAEEIKPVVLSCITHLPNFNGYHASRFEIVKNCLETMRNTEGEFMTLIWDNGSCEEFRRWVRNEYKPDIFIESFNVGKTQARKFITDMLPPHTIVNCSDDDMHYEKDWLVPVLKIHNTFPRVAAVTGYVVRTAFRWGCDNTIGWAKKNDILEAGRFLSEESEQEFCRSIGRDWEFHKARTQDELDYRATYKGVTAYLTSHHCQVLGRAGVLSQAGKYDGMAMGDEKPFDIALDNLGLRLGTINRVVRHIGNVPD